jgi:hypothetical protein
LKPGIAFLDFLLSSTREETAMKLIYPAILAGAALESVGQENIRQTMEEPLPFPLESSLALKVMDYVHPREVVRDDRLNPTEKRTILSAWASDACAVESRPGFRWLRGTPGPILVDHVLAALRTLDAMAGLSSTTPLCAGQCKSGMATCSPIAKRGATVAASAISA